MVLKGVYECQVDKEWTLVALYCQFSCSGTHLPEFPSLHGSRLGLAIKEIGTRLERWKQSSVFSSESHSWVPVHDIESAGSLSAGAALGPA